MKFLIGTVLFFCASARADRPCAFDMAKIIGKRVQIAGKKYILEPAENDRLHVRDESSEKRIASFVGINNFLGFINPKDGGIFAVQRPTENTLKFTHMESGAILRINLEYLPVEKIRDAQKTFDPISRFFIANKAIDIYYDGFHAMVMSQNYDDKIVINYISSSLRP